MATRNLPRTIVEGGRSNTYKTDRQTIKNRERREARTYCLKARFDPDFTEHEVDERLPLLTRRGERFADRLAPINRWLEANQGRPWDDVYSDLRRTLDIRTLKNWHYLDHVKKMVIGFGYPWCWSLRGASVDAEGILVWHPRRSSKRTRSEPVPKNPLWRWNGRWWTDPQLIEFFQLTDRFGTTVRGRLVKDVAGQPFWANRVEFCKFCRSHAVWQIDFIRRCRHDRYRQGSKLNSTEIAFWDQLPETVKRFVRF